jgi:RNA polymerase sigma-70 factor (ECF subfamily)
MPSDDTEFEAVVTAYYEPLYRFALGLSRSEADAADLTQRAFERFGGKSGALRDKSKTKTWLFTTLYRDFLQQKRHATRFPHAELDETFDDKIVEMPRAEISADANAAVAALQEMEEPFRSTLLLFYMNDHSYKEIAEILDVPIGTVMSRLARGKEMLRAKMIDAQDDVTAANAVEKEARV